MNEEITHQYLPKREKVKQKPMKRGRERRKDEGTTS